MKNLGLIPLVNFGIISEDREIYRCAQPLHSYQYEWLKNVLDIELMINLRAEKNIDELVCRGMGMRCISFDVKDRNPPTLHNAKEFIKIIKDSTYPIILHCEHGHGRTSTFSVLAQIALGKTLKEALKEEKSKFHYEFRHHIQEEFLKKNFK